MLHLYFKKQEHVNTSLYNIDFILIGQFVLSDVDKMWLVQTNIDVLADTYENPCIPIILGLSLLFYVSGYSCLTDNLLHREGTSTDFASKAQYWAARNYQGLLSFW